MTAQQLRTIRKRLRMTQVQLAERIGVSANSVARWERGEMNMRGTAERLIKILAQNTDLATVRRKK